MHKIKHYLKRFKELGIRASILRITDNLQKQITAWRLRKRALSRSASHSWNYIAKKHKLNSDFPIFFKQSINNIDLKTIYNNSLFITSFPFCYKNQQNIEKKAQDVINRSFSILGSQKITFETTIPWQSDFKYTQHPQKHPKIPIWHKKSNIFYHDITVSSPCSINSDQYAADIKIPWELSRLQFIAELGIAYHYTSVEQTTKLGHQKKEDSTKYAIAFKEIVSDWLDNNPYLLGANWKCPMDVALRAINLIWGIHFFYKSPHISESFWKRLISSLYDHSYYLEQNWEIGGKTSNHYFSDLIGYWYLSNFFSSIPYFSKMRIWCFDEIIKEIETQFFASGTNYEGSTNYHSLMSELLLHFYLVANKHNFTLSDALLQKISSAFTFLSDCIDQNNNFVQIGDNDSGKVFVGLTHNAKELKQVAETILPQKKTSESFEPLIHYHNFGLSIIKQTDWHITFRHPTYNKRQPSGHFHQDQLSITLSINGISVLVDPGSYLYTANSYWRNIFRSIKMHNTFYITEPPLGDQLFQLPRNERKNDAIFYTDKNTISIENWYCDYRNQHIKLNRKLTFNKQKNIMKLYDFIENKNKKNLSLQWHFIFAPNIRIEQDNTTWNIIHQNKLIAKLDSTLNLKRIQGKYSAAYGHIKETTVLTAQKNATGRFLTRIQRKDTNK